MTSENPPSRWFPRSLSTVSATQTDRVAMALFVVSVLLVALRFISPSNDHALSSPMTAVSAVLAAAATLLYGFRRQHRLVSLGAALTYFFAAVVEAVPTAGRPRCLAYSFRFFLLARLRFGSSLWAGKRVLCPARVRLAA